VLSLDAMRSELAALQAQCGDRYNVNFFCHVPPSPSDEGEKRWRAALSPYYEEFGIDAATIPSGSGRAPFTSEAADLLDEFKPAVVSFHFGLPSPELLRRVKACGAKVLSSATTVEEARWLEAHGVDAIIAQGLEAGGHRGMFLSSDLTTQIGTLALVPQIIRAVKLPVIAAGGIADAKGARGRDVARRGRCPDRNRLHALSRGCDKCSSSRGTEERGGVSHCAHESLHRPAGSWNHQPHHARAGPISSAAPAFPLATSAIAPLRAKAEGKGSGDFSPLWSGQNASGCKEISATELTRQLARRPVASTGAGF
jgi:nitronate monooxygenase